MANKTAGTSLADRAPARVAVADIPTALVAVVEPAEGTGKRQAYSWALDAYGTVTVRAYGPMGELLASEGLTLSGDDFEYKSMDRKSQVAMLFNEDGPLTEWFIRVDAPAAAIIDSVTITHA